MELFSLYLVCIYEQRRMLLITFNKHNCKSTLITTKDFLETTAFPKTL